LGGEVDTSLCLDGIALDVVGFEASPQKYEFMRAHFEAPKPHGHAQLPFRSATMPMERRGALEARLSHFSHRKNFHAGIEDSDR
jgi:hypothetical protein